MRNPIGWDKAVKEIEEIRQRMPETEFNPRSDSCRPLDVDAPLIGKDTFDPNNSECWLM